MKITHEYLKKMGDEMAKIKVKPLEVVWMLSRAYLPFGLRTYLFGPVERFFQRIKPALPNQAGQSM